MSNAISSPQGAGRVTVLGIAAGVVAVDQLTKQWALSALGDGEVIGEAGRWLSFHLVLNPGAAFSMGANSTWLFTVFSVVISLVLLREVWKGVSHPVWMVTLGALLGGAVGNLIDRLARDPGFGQGHVVDFIDYAGFFVGNIADIAIVGGALVLAALTFKDVPLRGRVAEPQEGPA